MPHTPVPTRSRWRQLLPPWATRHHTASVQHTLGWRQLHVLPTPAGCLLAVTLLVLLVASINFQLNLGYALTFLLAGSALASLWMGWRNLHGVQLQLGTLPAVFQGERAVVLVQLQLAAGLYQRYGLSVAMQRSQGSLAWVHTDLLPNAITTLALGSVPHQRGWHRVPAVVVESRFPLGVFRLWSYWQPSDRILVYPAPERPFPEIRLGTDAQPGLPAGHNSNLADSDGIRSYQRGDALRSIVWKKTATAWATDSGTMVVRERPNADSRSVWLDARATGVSDVEAQIARLTAWVLHAHEQRWQWGLRLPSGQQLPVASGSAHLQACLAALAVDGKAAAD